MKLLAWHACVLMLACKGRETPVQKAESADPLVRIEALKPKLAKARRLDFTTEVSASYQTTAEFREYMRRSSEKDAPLAKDRSAALIALGLLPPDADLRAATENAYASQAAAYYDPDTKRFFFVMTPKNNDTFDVVSAHELTHALQDQHFNLTSYLHAAESSDALTARRFVVEGDAMLASVACLVYAKSQLPELTSDQIRAMRPKLEQLAEAEPNEMAAILRQQASATSTMDPELDKALDSMASIPRTILVPLMDAYMKGAMLVLNAYERGGWKSVDALFEHPPESTEQVLHPIERFLAGTDFPSRVTIPKLDNYTLVDSDVLGELQWSVYFSLWKHDGGDSIHQNWDGDRYAVVRAEDGSLITLIATIWDSDYDARVFYDAYASSVENRYKGERRTDGDDTIVEHDHVATWASLVRDRVYVVDGAVDNDLIGTLIDGTTFDKRR